MSQARALRRGRAVALNGVAAIQLITPGGAARDRRGAVSVRLHTVEETVPRGRGRTRPGPHPDSHWRRPRLAAPPPASRDLSHTESRSGPHRTRETRPHRPGWERP